MQTHNDPSMYIYIHIIVYILGYDIFVAFVYDA